jgi:hypothetical protein
LLLKDTKTNNDTQLLPAQYKYEERKKERKKENDPKTHTHTKKENKQTNKQKKERKTNTLMRCWWASSVNEAPVISLPVI